jgi:hypothetical protein
MDDLKITATAIQVANNTSDLPSTLNQLPKFTNTTGKLGNSQIMDNGTNVGIGITTPTTKLDVNGSLKISGPLTLGANGTGTAGQVLTSNGTGVPTWTAPGGGGSSWNLNGNTVATLKSLGTIDNFDLPFITNNSEKMRILANGNVGIGTTTAPLLKLHAIGSKFSLSNQQDLSIADQFTVTTNSGGIGYSEAFLNGQSAHLGIYANPQVTNYTGSGGVGSYSSTTAGIQTNLSLVLGAGGAERMRVLTNGNVGIGTATPTAKLQVMGNTLIDYDNPSGNPYALTIKSTYGLNVDAINKGGADGTSAAAVISKNATATSVRYPHLYLSDKRNAGDKGLSFWVDGTGNSFINSYDVLGSTSANTNLSLQANGGNVGIGNTGIPTAKLHVLGDFRLVNGSQGANKVLTSDANGLATWASSTASTVNANNGLSNINNFIGLGGTLNKVTTINSMDSSLILAFNNGSYNKFGILTGTNPSFYPGTQPYIGNVQRYQKGRYILFNEKLVSNDDWFDNDKVFDTLLKTVTSYANDASGGFKWNIANYTGSVFNGVSERPVTGGVDNQDFRLGFDFSGLYMNGAYTGGAYNSNLVFQVLVDGTVKLKSPQNGTNQDSVLVWEAATRKVKKIAPSGLVTNNLWSANGNSIYKTDTTGKVMIGFNNVSKAGTHTLAVNGSGLFTKVTVKLYGTWPDYVFEENYPLRPLTEVEKFINLNKHLPEVTPEADIKKDGIDLGANQTILLKKVEELTLYAIDADKKITEQQKQIKALQVQQAQLLKLIEEVETLKKKVDGNK